MATFKSDRRKADPQHRFSGVERRATKHGSPNRDPISGAPGAHPVGTGLGAAAGGMAAGAAAGAVAGPVGAIAGAAIGAVAGGLAGKGVAEAIDPTVEEAYWSRNYTREPYYERGHTYADYHPGYRTGWEARSRHAGKTFDEVERELEADYERNRGNSRLDWEQNRHAARAAWQRFDPEHKPVKDSH